MITSPVSSGIEAPSGNGQAGELVIVRTGGFAGVNDILQIAADGTAQLTTGSAATSGCVPETSAVDRLRAIDLAAVAAAPSKQPIADGFTYTVTSSGATASASDGDNVGIRAEFVAAAGAVVASCLATVSGPGATSE